MLLAGAGVTLAYALPAHVEREAAPRIYGDLADVPPEPVAVVLGAAVYPDGSLSPVLQGRVDAAIELYRAGKARKLLMSGDNGRAGYDEPTAMKSYAVAHGIPPQDVVRDYAGFHTYDSCYRARHVFGITRAVFVTQAFHLPRSVYVADALGIDAVGYVAPDNMPPSDVAYFRRRERITTLGALLDLATRRSPKYPGPAERPITENRDPSR